MASKPVLLYVLVFTLVSFSTFPSYGQQLKEIKYRDIAHDFKTNGSTCSFLVDISRFKNAESILAFYNLAYAQKIFAIDKSELETDQARFTSDIADTVLLHDRLEEIIRQVLSGEQTFAKFSTNEPTISSNSNRGAAKNGEIPCSSSEVACSGNTYTFPSGTSGTFATPSVGGYPAYGCLGSQPCPAWYFMQVSQPGDMTVHIEQYSNDDPPQAMDVDFICWGPFNTMSDGCESGLTGGNIVDCSFSSAAVEDCDIPNAQVGEIYILLITNYTQDPGTITFSQTAGSGVTNCDIVYNCGIISLTADATACVAATNTFSVSGNVEFVNPPVTGTLDITDITVVPSVTVSLPVAAISSPQAYTINDLTCDGSVHTLVAKFSDDATCMINQTFSSPAALCPNAVMSGGGRSVMMVVVRHP